MKILKASAGAGKTFQLSGHYRTILLGSRDKYPYRHILAVTFTNKATAEMKARILKDLKNAAATDARADAVLKEILHDYSAFAVTTIDKFFQQTIRAFSRELGQFSAYQIELDKKAMIHEAMDRVLDSVTEDDHELINWIRASISEQLENGEKVNMEDGLHVIGERLKSEDLHNLCESCGIDITDIFTKERTAAVHKACAEIINGFEEACKSQDINVEHGKRIKRPSKTKFKNNPELEELFDKPYRQYNTALSIDKTVYNLGLAAEFFTEFDNLVKEKGIMCLDESNMLLHDIIDGSDAPFVYEKTGVRYEHFLLDEFQDTSRVQWENFKPLLLESNSGGGDNLIVGDVKQSIYRWRDSDWKLLGEDVEKEFGTRAVHLEDNWRSCRNIVDFNSGFFSVAAEKVGEKAIYSDVAQHPMAEEKQGGYVRASFRDDQLDAIVESVEDARAAGAEWSDIAILVRSKKSGSAVAEHLISKGYNVISDDSLNLKSSITVRRLISLLNGFDNPDDSIGKFLATEAGLDFPDGYHSLVDLCETLLRAIRDKFPEDFEGDTLFIQAFMDFLQEWVGLYGNKLREFLAGWEDKSDLFIGTPENQSSIRIMTVHKSKGLEFPYLIFPFAEEVTRYKHGVSWCRLDTKGTGLPEILDGIYPIDLTSDCSNSFFDGSYETEKRMQEVDNINLFYVALTRASKVLHVISKTPSKVCAASLDSGEWHFGNYAELLYLYTGGMKEFTYGSAYDFRGMKRKPGDGSETIAARYCSFPIEGRLRPSDDAADFFGEDGLTGYEASSRIAGIVLHDILSSVSSPDDLQAAVRDAVLNGKIDGKEAEEAERLLAARITAHPEWFPAPKEGWTVLNEAAIIDASGKERRADRVLVKGRKAIVIDYKFGTEEEKYKAQVRQYMDIYRSLGYEDTSGYVWYVREDKTYPLN